MTHHMPHPEGRDPECTRFDDRLMAYLENELDAPERAWMREHQSACATCCATLRDVEQLIQAAAGLPAIAPSRDLWAGIASRLDTPIVPLAGRATRTSSVAPPAPRRGLSVRFLAVAATVLVAVTSTITWQVAARRAAVQSALASGPARVTDTSLIVPVVNADVTYEREIAALRAIVSERFGELDSTTVSVLQRNLAIIDKAIADSRTALEKAPNSRVLSVTLNRALEAKLSLMRRVALL
ncbi:MAG: zf-HC2 domain-containing protein [Gemmatimonadaceae bacterium]|nr:zf-HC2 domain-containing protein [Gemmatimonadaceae bacterium]